MKKITLYISFLTLISASTLSAVNLTEIGPFNKSIGAVPYAKHINGELNVAFGRYKMNNIFYYGPLIDETFAGNASSWKWDDDNQIKQALKNIEISNQKVKMDYFIKTNLEGPFLGTGKNGHTLKLFIWDITNPPLVGSFNLWLAASFPENDGSWGFSINKLQSAQEVGGGDFYTTITLPPLHDTEYRMGKALWDAFKQTPLMQGATITSGPAPSQATAGSATTPPQPSQPTAATTGEVKAINENIKGVVALLPYYYDTNKNIHVLAGRYQDGLLKEEITSAPVEIAAQGGVSVAAIADGASKQYFSSAPITKDVPLPAYSIGKAKFKNYYLLTIEIPQAQAVSLLQSLLQQPTNTPTPTTIVDINLNDYISGKLMGANVKAQTPQPLFTDFMRSGKIEMKAARGFADGFQEAIANIQVYFPAPAAPITPSQTQQKNSVAGSLTALADALNQLAPNIK